MLESMTKQDSHHCGIIEVSGYNQEKITLGVGGMKKLVVLAVAGLMSVTASAENWVLVSQNSDATMYVDIDSIANSGKYKTVFIRNIYAKPKFVRPSVTVNQDMALLKIDCKSNPKRRQIISETAYNGATPVVSSGHKKNPEWNAVYPGTFGASLVSLVCSR